MTQRQALYAAGGVLGAFLALSLAIPEFAGIGPELRAHSSRLAKAKMLGLDSGAKARLAREATKPEAARRAFTRLNNYLRVPQRFELPKAIAASSPGAPPQGAIPVGLPTGAASRKSRPLESYRADLRHLGELARAAIGGSHREWAKGYELSFSEFAELKNGLKLADELAQADAAGGRFDEATQNLLDSVAPWRVYGDEPVVIGELARTTSASLFFRASGRLLAHPSYPAAEAKRLAEVAEGLTFAPRISLREILLMETAMSHDLLERPEALKTLSSDVSPNAQDLEMGMRFTQVRRAWQSDALHLMNDAVPKLPTDPYDFDGARPVLEDYERQATTPRGLRGRFMETFGTVYYAGLVDAQKRREAMRRVLLVAAALRAGESEAALRQRLGPLALDPYDDLPIRIRPAVETPFWLTETPSLPIAKRLRAVYSIGSNRFDDGGRAAKKMNEGDIVLVIPR